MGNPSRTPFAHRLKKEMRGQVFFDAFTRGRYSTDASIYQIAPMGVAVPASRDDLQIAVQVALDFDIPVILRGGGTSQGGQPLGTGLVIDTSKHLSRVLDHDASAGRVTVEPGIVLDDLNRTLAPHGSFFPVDPSTANRATVGGMVGNNSAGARSIVYGLMVDNVVGVEAMLADGSSQYFGPPSSTASEESPRLRQIKRAIRDLYQRERDELDRRIPRVARHVAGYNLHRIGGPSTNFADMLVGSEGTLGVFTHIDLQTQPLPAYRALGVCHFPSLHAAMSHTQDVVQLGPSAVELVDSTVIRLARDNPAFRSDVDLFLRGDPAALLLVEFIADTQHAVLQSLDRLAELMGSLGFPDTVVPAVEPEAQRRVWSVRKAALNIVMSMKGSRKPVSFIEDCAVPLEHLADYTAALEDIFQRHGTTGTWYAHASVGCLHVRPALNIKNPVDVTTMRRIVDEAHDVVRLFKGSHSGEHGDGIVRSEFIEPMLGRRIAKAFAEIKEVFDPKGLLNPGKITAPHRMDDADLFRYPPSYEPAPTETTYDWSEWSDLLGAVEMCNNNGACRKRFDGVMCPSYRVTADEEHTTRGRANVLRLALTGQLGTHAMTSPRMYDAMDLCVGCKACRRECPAGVDMARMKTEFLYQYRKRTPANISDLLVAHLPRYAPIVSRVPWLGNTTANIRSLRRITESVTGLTANRALPRWRRDFIRDEQSDNAGENPSVALFVDTFARYFEPETVRAAARVLRAAGHAVMHVTPRRDERPLCCGRTYINAGMMDEARTEASRTLESLASVIDRGIPVVGLEPSCLLTFRDEYLALFPGPVAERVASNSFTFEEFLVRSRAHDGSRVRFNALDTEAVVHGHCHQKAFGVANHVTTVLEWIPELRVREIQSTCCGMAGAFGYESRHYDTSMRMAELDLLPEIRRTDDATLIVADGTSCRAQIQHGVSRTPYHAAQILAMALDS